MPRRQVDETSMITTTVVINIAKAMAAQSSQGVVRRTRKPISAMISNAAAISSAISAAPLIVSMKYSWGRGTPAARRPFVAVRIKSQ